MREWEDCVLQLRIKTIHSQYHSFPVPIPSITMLKKKKISVSLLEYSFIQQILLWNYHAWHRTDRVLDREKVWEWTAVREPHLLLRCFGKHLWGALETLKFSSLVQETDSQGDKEHGFWSQNPWVQILTLPLTGCVTLGTLFNPSLICSVHIYKMEVIIIVLIA